MNELTNDAREWLKEQSQTLFPELFDDANAKSKLNVLITNAWIKNRQYKNYINDDEIKQVLLFYTAHLLNQSEQADGDASSVHLNDLSFSFQNESNNGSDPYLTQYQSLLHSLNLGGWGIDIS